MPDAWNRRWQEHREVIMSIREFTKERAEEKPLTVGELRKMLRKLPKDMQLIQTRYSDYGFQTASMWTVVEAVINDEWLMRVDESMPAEQRAKAQKYFHVEGN